MKIYVSHAACFDYQNELYKPLRASELNKKHEITLPYDQRDEPINTKEFIKECDLVIAEVSYPSIGQGIELGWADIYKTPVICLYRTGSKLSRSLKIITQNFIEYENSIDMIEKLKNFLQ